MPSIPFFEPVIVADRLNDGYWIQACDLNGDGRPDLVASGLAVGEVVWYENPTWKARPIATFPKPVALDAGDIDGDGRPDLVVCHDYGSCMYHCRPEDGKISWVKNPGTVEGEPWRVFPIADLMATHRLRLGHFTQTHTLELLALPVVGPRGVHEPVQLTLYRTPPDVRNTNGWQSSLVDDTSFRVIHDVVVGRFGAAFGADLDSVLLGSEEGISWLRYSPDEHRWLRTALGEGELGEVNRTGFKGTGNLAVGRIGDDPYAYIAAIEPFHGNTVAIYIKDATRSLTSVTWRRTVLDVFGDPNAAGEGPGHHVMTGDFDGDGDDEFLVALRGPMPWQGVFYYKVVDLFRGQLIKTRVSSASAARIALADFDGDGRLDFATTGYYTPGYFLCENPQILVFLNRFGRPVSCDRTPARPSL
ncbi:MAG TPA: FG-GAP-like repeat-containing protein [Gemmataceae bacterium]|nr:FG-GAP-like repeat-containing protein [Gemmataceae bacterium]